MLLEAILALTTVLPRLDAGAEGLRTRLAALERPAAATLAAKPSPLPYFSVTARAVSNWREQAGGTLMPRALALVVQHAQAEPAFVARCVRLNNYWCVKQARWAGELGGDAEGHTGFATAADGADAAAQLLRRYYREYNRRTALAIVRRWAPAECGVSAAAPVRRRSGEGAAKAAASAPVPKVSAEIAPQGLSKNLRARFLAGHARGGAPRRVAKTVIKTVIKAPAAARPVAVARSGGDAALRVQPWSARARLAGHPGRASRVAKLLAKSLAKTTPPPLKPVADIASGIGLEGRPGASRTVLKVDSAAGPRMPPTGPAAFVTPSLQKTAAAQAVRRGATDAPRRTVRDRLLAESASLPSLIASLPGGHLIDMSAPVLSGSSGSGLSAPAPVCGNDETRIRNYAARIAASVGLTSEDDLGLFEADGTPTLRLAPVMLAMSAVELGALHASPSLVAAAIERLAGRLTAAAALVEPGDGLRLSRN